jgi:hypothetical protein
MSTRALHSHGHAVARKVTAFADTHPISPVQGTEWSACTGKAGSVLPQTGSVWSAKDNAYLTPFNGMIIGGTCQNVDGQPCGNDSVVVNGQCTPLNVSQADTAISGKSQKYYETWVKNYYTLMDQVLKQYEADGVTLNGTKIDSRYVKGMEKYLGKERAAMLYQIKHGHAPAVFFKASISGTGDTNLFSSDLGGIPISTVMYAARDGSVPNAATVALSGDPEGIAALKALNRSLTRVTAKPAAPANPFPVKTAHSVFTTPSRGGSTPVAAANWWQHDQSAAGNAAAIAASNANANADIQHAVDTGHLLDNSLAVAAGGPFNSADPEIPQAPGAEPTGHMAPQVQPGSGSQYVAPPSGPNYQLTGFELDIKSLVPIGIAFFLLYCLSKYK